MTFSSETLDAMVTLTDAPDGTVRVDGWIAPAAAMRVEVLLDGSTLEVEADEDGRFVLESVPKGLAKLALHPRRPDGPQPHDRALTGRTGAARAATASCSGLPSHASQVSHVHVRNRCRPHQICRGW